MELPEVTSTWGGPPSHIRRAPGVSLTAAEVTMLARAFASSRDIFVERELRSGYSGAVVLLVSTGPGYAPVVVKMGSPTDLQREYVAYRQFVEPASPQNTAHLQGEPLLAEDRQLALLTYSFAGGDPRLPTRSLQAYYDSQGGQATAVVLDRIFRVYGRQWWANNHLQKFTLGEQYDRLLPVHLKLKPVPLAAEKSSEAFEGSEPWLTLLAGQINATSLTNLQPGQQVRLQDFEVAEMRLDRGEITLIASPPPEEASAPLRLRLESDHTAAYRPGDRLETLDAVVTATRQMLLVEAARSALPGFDPDDPHLILNGLTYPNPLRDLSDLLDRVVEARVSTIHGDLSLQNILVDGATGFAWLIDFTETRLGPALFDLQRLEAQVITKLLLPAIAQAGLEPVVIAELLKALCTDPPSPLALHTTLQEPYNVLVTLRRLARQYLVDDRDWSEYYLGLVIVLLGTLKFDDLEPLARGLALVGATVAWGFVVKPATTGPFEPTGNHLTPGQDVGAAVMVKPSATAPSPGLSQWPRWIGYFLGRRPTPTLLLALVINVQGWVEVRRQTSDRVVQAVFGMPLFFGDAVITYEGSTADIVCKNGNLFHLDKQSTLVVRCGETDDQPPIGRLLPDLSQRLVQTDEIRTIINQADLAVAEQAIHDLPLNEWAQGFLRARLYRHSGLPEKAITELEELVNQGGRPGLVQSLGDAYYQAGLLDQAATNYTAALDEANLRGDPISQAEAHLGLGHIAKVRGKVDTAIVHWQTAESLYKREGYLVQAQQITVLLPTIKSERINKFRVLDDARWSKVRLKQLNLSNLLDWIKANMPSDGTRALAIISIMLTLLLFGSIMLSPYWQCQLTLDEQAQTLTDSFRNTTDLNARLANLAKLFNLAGYEAQAQQLFYDELTPEERLAFFNLADAEEGGPYLIIVVRGLYTGLDNNERDNALLQAMGQSLEKVNDVKAANLAMEIKQWLQGRTYYAQGEYDDAITIYDIMIEQNDLNPGVYYDRGRAYAALGEADKALADFEMVLKLNPGWQTRIELLVTSNSLLYEAAIADGSAYPAVVALAPSPTSTPTPTSTPVTLIDSPTPTKLLPTYTSTPPENITSNTPVPLAGIVIAEKLNIRQGPGSNYGLVGGLEKGDKIIILRRAPSGNWLEIMTPDGKIGWVATKYVELPADIAIALIPIATMITSPLTITATLTRPVVLLNPLNNAAQFRNRIELEWDWAGTLGPNDYFQVEIRNRYNAALNVIDEFVYPIDVAWVKDKFYQHDYVDEAYDREYTWRIIVVRYTSPEEPLKEKNWAKPFPELYVWEPPAIDKIEWISQPSEMRTLYVEAGNAPPAASPPAACCGGLPPDERR